MIITVDHDSPTPAFEQLRVAIRRLVATGALPVGTKLPTVRQLSADLALAPGTVVRAFRELESEGIIETRGRHGTRVKGLPEPPHGADREEELRDAALTYAAIAAELMIGADVALEHVRVALAGNS